MCEFEPFFNELELIWKTNSVTIFINFTKFFVLKNFNKFRVYLIEYIVVNDVEAPYSLFEKFNEFMKFFRYFEVFDFPIIVTQQESFKN